MKHREHFTTFFDLMLKEMDRHHPEKGDSWLDDCIEMPGYVELPTKTALNILLNRCTSDYRVSGNSDDLVDIANVCAMIRLREMLKDETST